MNKSIIVNIEFKDPDIVWKNLQENIREMGLDNFNIYNTVE
jgi:hypothetical protein